MISPYITSNNQQQTCAYQHVIPPFYPHEIHVDITSMPINWITCGFSLIGFDGHIKGPATGL
jgi:hypothetical protein